MILRPVLTCNVLVDREIIKLKTNQWSHLKKFLCTDGGTVYGGGRSGIGVEGRWAHQHNTVDTNNTDDTKRWSVKHKQMKRNQLWWLLIWGCNLSNYLLYQRLVNLIFSLSDGKGIISEKDMRHVLTTIGEKLTDEEVDSLYRLSGCVERGAINYHSKYNQVVY